LHYNRAGVFWAIFKKKFGAENEKKHPKTSKGFEGKFRHFLE
jgi:hypothetical protein